jgi:hypothetical protein
MFMKKVRYGKLRVTYVARHGDGSGDEEFEINDLTFGEIDAITELTDELCRKNYGGMDMRAACTARKTEVLF